VPCPSDREVRLAIGASPRLTRMLAALEPDAIHIATKGPLGAAFASLPPITPNIRNI
jgi:hypothetical protein